MSTTKRRSNCFPIKVAGMFLFAKLVMSNLLSQVSRAKLRKELAPDVLPVDVEKA